MHEHIYVDFITAAGGNYVFVSLSVCTSDYDYLDIPTCYLCRGIYTVSGRRWKNNDAVCCEECRFKNWHQPTEWSPLFVDVETQKDSE